MKALQFTGRGSEFFKIWIVNLLLTIVTLGLYWPWAKVHTIRYFYGNTSFEKRSLDYHATGKQIFMSYVIALLILIVYAVVSNISPILGLIMLLGLVLLIPWIIWRSLMFDARMTSFSNVRFGFYGALGQAYLIYLLLPVGIYLAFSICMGVAFTVGAKVGSVIGLVFGLAAVAVAIFLLALNKKKIIEYVIDNLKFGQGEFAVEVEKSKLIMIYVKAFALGVAVFAVVVGLAAVIGFDFSDIDAQSLKYAAVDPNSLKVLMVDYVALIFVILLMAAYAYAEECRYVYSLMTFDENVRFKSTVTARSFIFIMLTNLLLVILTLGFGTPWAAVRMYRYITENTHVDASGINLDEYLTQEQENQSAFGEQLGEVFDVGSGVGF